MEKDPRNWAWLIICAVALSAIASSCGKSEEASTQVSGRASAGPIGSGTVIAYELNTDGSAGTELARATTDSEGNYSLPLGSKSSPVLIKVSGGSFKDEASGETQYAKEFRVLLGELKGGQVVGISPLTEIAANRALKLKADGLALADAVRTGNEEMAKALGLSDITVPPANPYATLSDPTAQEAKLALFAAGFSKMAKDNGVDHLELIEAFARDFADGAFDGKDHNNATVGVDGSGISLGATGAMSFVGVQQDMQEYVAATPTFGSVPIPTPTANPDVVVPPAVLPPTTFVPPTGYDGYNPGTSPGTTPPTAPSGAILLRITAPSSVSANACSSAITIQSYNGSNTATAVSANTSVTLSSSGGAFYSNSTCTSQATNATIAAGASSVTVYFKSAMMGTFQVMGSAAGLNSGGAMIMVQ